MKLMAILLFICTCAVYGRHVGDKSEIDVIDVTQTTHLDSDYIEFTSAEQELETNTVVSGNPPMVCWELSCPECAVTEHSARCFLRGFLQVVIRGGVILASITCLVMCLCLCACVKNKTTKKNVSNNNFDKKPLIT